MLVQEKNSLDRSSNRVERAAAKNASPAAMFEKVLRAFEIGDLSFADLLSSLTRLLKDHAPPMELLEVLRRRELIDPLPAEAREKIISVLQESMPVGAVEAGADSVNQIPSVAVESAEALRTASLEEEPDASAMARVIKDFVAAWDREPKPSAVASTAAPEPSARHVDYKAMRLALAQREDDLAALHAEHTRVLGLLEARARSGAQLQEELRELAGQLEVSRGALQSQKGRTREIEQVLAERISAQEAARARIERARGEEAARQAELHQLELNALRESLAAREASIDDMTRALAEREAAVEHANRSLAMREEVIGQARGLLADRDAQIAALRDEHAQLAPKLESGAQAVAKLQVDLAAAQSHIATLEAAVASSKAVSVEGTSAERDRALEESNSALEAQKQQHAKIVAAFMARAKATENELRAARGRIESLASELQNRDRAAAFLQRTQASKSTAAIEAMAPAATVPVSTEPAGAMPADTAPAATAPHFELRRGVEIGEFAAPPATRGAIRKPNSIAGTLGIAAALIVLAVIAWVVTHRVPSAAKAPAVAAAPAPKPGTVIHDCPTCPAFTVLPAGRFKQGSVDSSASSAVRPVHWVAIDHPFAISTNAVTVDQFRAFITATGRDMQGCDTYDGRWKHQPKNSWQNPGFEQSGSHPVTCASWSDAKAYAQWLSQQTGHRYRLPSASEWEYAARAGSEAAQPWGPTGSDACANANVADLSAAHRYPGWVAYACNDGYVFTAPVGSFKASAFGLNDMLGNVFQWTEDCWNANYKGAPVDGSARTDGNCAEHELRGGSWFSSPGFVRVDYRNHFAADYRTSSVGIRLARDIAP